MTFSIQERTPSENVDFQNNRINCVVFCLALGRKENKCYNFLFVGTRFGRPEKGSIFHRFSMPKIKKKKKGARFGSMFAPK